MSINSLYHATNLHKNEYKNKCEKNKKILFCQKKNALRWITTRYKRNK